MITQKPFATVIVISIVLISFSVVYKFVIEPTYSKYELSQCLNSIEKHVNAVKTAECVVSKKRLLKSCLINAQSSIYCRDVSHQQPITTGLLGGSGRIKAYDYDPYICKSPDNSDGYWNDNMEYQELALKCEQDNVSMTCQVALQGALDAFASTYRDKESALCFRRY